MCLILLVVGADGRSRRRAGSIHEERGEVKRDYERLTAGGAEKRKWESIGRDLWTVTVLRGGGERCTLYRPVIDSCLERTFAVAQLQDVVPVVSYRFLPLAVIVVVAHGVAFWTAER